ncbi:AAA family ATPase [Deinococcus sonorensis]|uniref:AAA family ATPase n=1 Tax=Deinococcus sonorensis TaxID=309891 RepID=A0ABV8YB77_9DEIO
MTRLSAAQDVTTDAEYQAALQVLPADVRAYVQPQIRNVEEVTLDLGGYLQLKLPDLRVTYPLRVTPDHLTYLTDVVGRFTGNGRRGIDGTLHRVGGNTNAEELIDKVSLRVARVIAGVAEPMREAIERSPGVAIIGPPAVGKTTLLRDVCRIRLETIGAGLCVVDSDSELCGAGRIPHPLLARARIFRVGEPGRQARQLSQAIRNHGAEEVATDEVQPADVPLLMTAYNNGVAVTCSLHGRTIGNIVNNLERRILMGAVENPRDGTVSLREQPIFSLVIEVHGKGRYRVIENVPQAVARTLRGELPAYWYVGEWSDAQRQAAERLNLQQLGD